MALPADRLQEIIWSKDTEKSVAGEGWAIINDEAIVIYDFENPPAWLSPILKALDEDGNLSEPHEVIERSDYGYA